MSNVREKQRKRKNRHYRIRKTIQGTPERPRLCVSPTINNIYAQIIDDTVGRTIITVSTLSEEMKKALKSGGNVAAAKVIGKRIAEEAVKKGIQKIAFDRGHSQYHGRVKALADAAREAGLKF